MHASKHVALAGAVILAGWLGLVALSAAQLALLGTLEWSEAIGMAAPFWFNWLLLAPLVVWLGFRFPVERPHWPRNLAIHLIAGFLVVALGQAPRRDDRTPGRGFGPPGNPAVRGPELRDPHGGPPFFRGGPPARGPLGRGGPFRGTFDLMLYAGIASACHAVAFLRRSRRRERQTLELESRLAQAKLQALRMQLNPHFLFNTLNAISSLVHTDPMSADEMISDLSHLLRGSLDTANDQEITLRKELDFLERYLAIERRRFGDRLHVEQHVPVELLESLVPTLLLQPLVENAVRHGVERRRGRGLISITVLRQDRNLLLRINDRPKDPADPGRPAVSSAPQTAPDLSKTIGKGIGLSNTKARLVELYGSRHSLNLHQSTEEGFTVEISIPLRMAAP